MKCSGCGHHFDPASRHSVQVVLNRHEDDEETLDFCSQSCLDTAAARGAVVGSGNRFGKMSRREYEQLCERAAREGMDLADVVRDHIAKRMQ